MGNRAFPFAGGFLSAFTLAILSACSNQEPEGNTEETWDTGPYLESLVLVQESMAAGDSTFLPREVPMSPEPPEREYAHFGGRVYPGGVALLPFTNSKGVISVRFRGAGVQKSQWTDGKPCYRFAIDSGGDVEVAVRDTNSGLRRIYRVSLAMRSLGEPGEASLKAVSLEEYFILHFNAFYSAIAISPVFHPDTLEYLAMANKGAPLRLMATPLDPYSDIVVALDGKSLEAQTLYSSPPAFFAVNDTARRFQITVTHRPSGSTRNYSLAVGLIGPAPAGPGGTSSP